MIACKTLIDLLGVKTYIKVRTYVNDLARHNIKNHYNNKVHKVW